MTPEQWHEIRDKLHAALEMEPVRRYAYLADLAAMDPELHHEVESLLACHDGMSTDFLDSRISHTPTTGPQGVLSETFVARQLGPYRIVDQLGTGGMGEVFRAVRADEQYQKEVAIKLVRTGQDSGFVTTRFKNERQILATLEHPNIARLLDGGATEEGVPYLVMELVEGKPLTVFCDEHKLAIPERLKLFLQVCSAVQYAHQRLIIHRDIKPSNVLVTKDRVPKLLDFGIAKILDPTAVGVSFENTLTAFRLLTPAYASPEQVRGETITTASDVYSLGVVLYELLTGRSPYRSRKRTSDQISRAVCEIDPEKPSTVVIRTSETNGAAASAEKMALARDSLPEKLRKRLHGDLDNIVLMALRKEPQRRYSSVEQFAADIGRHLQDLPVVARGDNARYRAGKFVTRHRAAVVAGVVVCVALLAGLVATLREARIARIQRTRAEQRFKDVRELANSDLFELHDALQKLPDSASVRNLVIQRALKYLAKLSEDAGGDRELMHELAAGYERIAALQGNFSGPGIGDTSAALASYEKALVLREFLVASSNGDVNERKADVELMGAYGQCLQIAGNTGKAKGIAERAVAISDGLLKDDPADAHVQMAAALASLQLASVLGGNGSSPSTREIPQAISRDEQALRTLERIAGFDTNEDARRAAAKVKMFLASHLSKERRFGESEKILNEAIAAEKSSTSPSPAYLYDLYNWRGLMFERLDDQAKALADYERTKDLAGLLVRSNPHDLREQLDLEIANAHIAMQVARLGGKGAEVHALNTAVTDGEHMFAANPGKLLYRNLLTEGYCYQAEVSSLSGKVSEAIKQYSKALEMAKSITESDTEDLESQLHIDKIHDALGTALAQAGESERARQEFGAAVQGLHDLLQIRPHDAEALYVSRLVQNHAAQLEVCSRAHACGKVQWQLPSSIN